MASKTLLKLWIRNSNVGVLELNSPKNRNALSLEMLQQLQRGLSRFESDPCVCVIVLQAESPVFSSGHDLNEIRQYQKEGGKSLQHLFDVCSQTMMSIVKSNTPVVAKVDGVATAAGCQLVASCDLAYASTRSKFATPGVNLGLFCSTPAVAVGRSVSSRKHVMEMLLTGNPISARHAQDIGLINRAVSEQELDSIVDHVADTIASKSQSAISRGKSVFARQMEEPSLDDAYSIASQAMCEHALTEDCIEGIDAFLDKRQPKW